MTTVSPHTAMETAIALLRLAQAQPPSVARSAGLIVVVISVVIAAVLAAFRGRRARCPS